ncbi:MAG: endonuclease/exonuclease/phosphatase family protein [Pseudomonadales bacterium]
MRIATYNVQNLFASSDQGNSKPTVALKAVARTLDLMAADVVALQEVAGEAALAELNTLLRDPYAHAHSVHSNSQRGIHLAYLSRHPLLLRSHRELMLADCNGTTLTDYEHAPEAASATPKPLRLQRDLLRADVAFGGNPKALTLFNVHFKSKAEQAWRLLSSDEIRTAEARAVAAQIADLGRTEPQQLALLLGDFNDQLSSPTLAAIRNLNWCDGLAFDHAQLGRSGRLPGTYWSKRRLRIDYVLLNANAERALVPASVRVHASTLAQRGSDHYPVSVDVSL